MRLQIEASWGSSFLPTLSRELMEEFPQMRGFSVTNLKSMRRFYVFYRQDDIKSHQLGGFFEQTLFTIPWRHHIEIIRRCSDLEEAMFYINETINNNWSRAVLLNILDSCLHKRQSKAVNNFQRHLPSAESDLAAALIKDPYNFDFLTITKGYKERELEGALTENIEGALKY